MARESYVFNVDANTKEAERRLDAIYKKMNDIDKVNAKGRDNFGSITQKDMTKSMGAIREVTEEYKMLKKQVEETTRHLDRMSNMKPPSGASDDIKKKMTQVRQDSAKQAQEARQQLRDVERQYQQILMIHRQSAEFQQTPTKSHTHIFNSKDMNNFRDTVMAMAKETDPAIERVEKLKQEMRELKKLDSRTTSDSRRATASGYMSFQQARSFEADMNTGIYTNDEKRRENLERLGQLSDSRRKLHDQVKGIENSPSSTDEELHKKVALQEEIAHHDEEMRLRQDWNKQLERSIQDSKKKLADVQAVDPSVKPERGTTAGMLYERAPSVGLAASASVAGIFGGLYSQGAGAKQNSRQDVVSISQRTGQANTDFNTRKNAEQAGLANDLGLTAQEMLAFQEAYLSNSGYGSGSSESKMDNLLTASQGQAMFSRASGIDTDTVRQAFGELFKTGAVNGGTAKDIQAGFLGAIKQSGMEGREKEQLEALQGLVAQNSQGRQVTTEQMMNMVGLQSALASTGERVLQGEQGGNLLQSLDQGFKGAADDPQMRMLFGMGTEFQGIEGRLALTKQLEEGTSNPKNLKRMFDVATGMGSTEGEQEMYFRELGQQLGGMTVEQSQALMQAGRQGKLDEDTIKAIMEGTIAQGEEITKNALDNYTGMKEATENQSEATTEKQASGLNDMATPIKELNTQLGTLHPALYGVTKAVGALSLVILGAAASFAGSSLLRGRMAGGLFGGGRGGGRGGGSNSGGANPRGGPTPTPSPIVGADGRPLNSTQNANPNPNPNGGGRGGIGGWFSNLRGGSGTGSSNLLGGGGLGGSAMNVLGKALLPLSMLMGAGAIATAPEGEKAETTGGVVGSIGGGVGGGMAGATIGATIGSLIPGVGTAIGGVAGGLIGSLGGSFGGGALGGSIGKWFGGSTAEASEGPEGDITGDSLDAQMERENTNQQDKTENRRADNIADETSNLNFFDKLLTRATEILAIARQQNGIFGSAGTGGGMGGLDGSGGLGYVAGGGYTDGDIRKHDLAQTDETLTAQDIDAWINSKAPKDSVMRGMGEAFMQAGLESGLDPRYLVAHAAHETGWGTSNIAKQKGNMYGIGAFDASPYASAYGYDNAQAGIIEGAKWIKKNYYDKGQTTLDSMRHNGGKHEYATDPLWDEKIAGIMKGAPMGSGTVKVESKVEINVNGVEDIKPSLERSNQLKDIGQRVSELAMGSMQYLAQERVRL